MAVDNAVRLLSKIIKSRDISEALSRGVRADWFERMETKQVWEFLTDHYEKYGEVPTATTVRDNYPTFRLLEVKDTQEYLLDQLVDYYRLQQASRMVDDALSLLDQSAGTEEIIELMRKRLSEIDAKTVQKSGFLDLADSPMDRWQEYLNRQANPGTLLGVGTGFPTIDEATSGLQGGQLVVIVAPAKVGKTQLMLRMAAHVHEQGKRPVFQSFEMTNAEQVQRYDAMQAGVSYTRMREGQLTKSELVRYENMLQALDSKHPFWLTESAGSLTVSGVSATVATVDPDVIFVDGTYLMVDEQTGEMNTPQALTNITRSLKRMAQRFNKPVVISTQALAWKMKGNTVSSNSVGYSSSFAQDADVMLGIERVEELHDVRLLKILLSRSSGLAEVELDWDWDRGIFSERTGSVADDQEDDGEELEFDVFGGATA